MYRNAKLLKLISLLIFVHSCSQVSCPLAASAPLEDLKLATNIQSYASIDKTISDAALRALNRLTRYLTGELIPLVLWDNKLAMKEQETLAKSLSSLSSPSDNQQLLKRFGTGFGKPVLPEITGQEPLRDIINDDSM